MPRCSNYLAASRPKGNLAIPHYFLDFLKFLGSFLRCPCTLRSTRTVKSDCLHTQAKLLTKIAQAMVFTIYWTLMTSAWVLTHCLSTLLVTTGRMWQTCMPRCSVPYGHEFSSRFGILSRSLFCWIWSSLSWWRSIYTTQTEYRTNTSAALQSSIYMRSSKIIYLSVHRARRD